MSYKVLSLKWRPAKFQEIVGQDHITRALSNAIRLDRIAHAYTFSGPRGVGKTTTARILAMNLNQIDNIAKSIDIIEMDAASNRGIDEIRNLRENINYAPSEGKYKIYIIDEAHMLTKEAFNALLKTLEEPPEYVVFILATTELHKMPDTIISRTQRYDFRRISNDDIEKHLKLILKDEKIKYDDHSITMIAEKADGSLRDSLSLLDQMICFCSDNINIKDVKEALGIVDKENYAHLLGLIGKKNSGEILKALDELLNKGISINDFILGFNSYLRDCILSISLKGSKENPFSELDLLRILEICLRFQINLKNYKQPNIVLESLMIKLSYLENTIDIGKFLHDNRVSSTEINKGNSSSEINHSINKEDEDKNKVEAKDLKIHNDEKPINNTLIKKNIENHIKEEVKEEPAQDLDISKNKETISLDSIETSWSKIVENINKKNPKTAVFLEEVALEKLENDLLTIVVENGNQFTENSLNKDKKMIEEVLNDSISGEASIKVAFELSEIKKEVDDNKDDKINQDKENPLFMDALNKFKGEIIK